MFSFSLIFFDDTSTGCAHDRLFPSVFSIRVGGSTVDCEVPDWVSCCLLKENDNEKDEFVASH